MPMVNVKKKSLFTYFPQSLQDFQDPKSLLFQYKSNIMLTHRGQVSRHIVLS